MYNNTITMFNKYVADSGAIYWYPKVLQNVDLITDKNANMAKLGLESADKANLHVRYSIDDSGAIIVSGLKVLGYDEWAEIIAAIVGEAIAGETEVGEDDRTDVLTFNTGDFFMAGEYADADAGIIADADYAGRQYGGFYGYLNKLHKPTFLVTNIGGPYSLIPHYEIGGT